MFPIFGFLPNRYNSDSPRLIYFVGVYLFSVKSKKKIKFTSMLNVGAVIADRQPVFRKGLKDVLESASIRVNACFDDGRELMDYLKRCPSELLILDLNLKSVDGLDVVKWVKVNLPRTRVIILTAYDDIRLIKMARKMKVEGYLMKTLEVEQVKSVVGDIINGRGEGIYYNADKGYAASKNENSQLAGSFEDAFMKKQRLTKREQQIVKLIASAMSSKEIAETLFISDQTVSVHRKNIMRKLGVSSTAALIKVAFSNGWG